LKLIFAELTLAIAIVMDNRKLLFQLTILP